MASERFSICTMTHLADLKELVGKEITNIRELTENEEEAMFRMSDNIRSGYVIELEGGVGIVPAKDAELNGAGWPEVVDLAPVEENDE